VYHNVYGTVEKKLKDLQESTGKVVSVPVTVAVRSEAWVLAGWLLGSWV
jgi:hypothetical protein